MRKYSLISRAGGVTPAAGFSLLELMIVLGLMGLMCAYAVPRAAQLTQLRQLRSQAGRLGATLRYAYTLAAITGVRHRVNCELVTGRYWISGQDADGDFAEIDDVLARPRRLANAVRFMDLMKNEQVCSEGTAFVEFAPGGFSSGAVIHLQQRQAGRIVSVVLSPFIGETEVCDAYVQG